jgi:hypothetical protein
MAKELAMMHHEHPTARARAFKAACKAIRATLSPEEQRVARITQGPHGIEVRTIDGRLLGSETLARARATLARLKVQAAADPR